MMHTLLRRESIRLAPENHLDRIAWSTRRDDGASGRGLVLPSRIPDLNDPVVRQLPISALALVFAMLESSAPPEPSA